VAILEIKNLTRRFGGLVAVNNLEFSINAGEIVALIGPNGAGKTTAFSMISGFQKPDAGSIIFDNRDITGLPPHLIAERGLTLVGFAVSNIDRDGAQQLELPFETVALCRRPGGFGADTFAIDEAVDKVRQRYGNTALTRGVLLGLDPGLEMPHLPD